MATADRREWVEYEANVRCPVVAGRGRVGIGRSRKDLAREWTQQSLANRNICIKAVRDGQRWDRERLVLTGPALIRLQEAIAIRNSPTSNWQTDDYFEACRDAHQQHVSLRVACVKARDAWRRLHMRYETVPLATRSAGQIASIAEARRRRANANQVRVSAAVGMASTTNWLTVDPIYRTPISNIKVRERDVPRERSRRRSTELQRNFTSDGVPAGMWFSVMGREVYERGDDVNVRVWFQINDNGNITDRMVRKEQYVDSLHDFGGFQGVLPWELECHRLVALKAVNNPMSGIVPLRDTNLNVVRSWVDRVQKSYKVYMTWCPHGTLSALIHAQRQLPSANGQFVPFPEPMIWNVAESLIRSGQLMVDLEKDDDGEQMVHRDLKPSNAMLGAADPNNYPDYPQVLVTDFGQAFMTSVDDERNPDWWNSGATDGFRPPELERYVDPGTLLPIFADQLLEHTNVWQAGAVLRALVLLQRLPVQSLFLDGANDTTYRVNIPGTQAATNYSADILKMIDDMMAYAWDRRPTFGDLAATISSLADVSQGMRDATATPGQRTDFGVAVRADGYVLGMAPPAPPLPPP